MNISIIGTGYVGLVQGVALASFGHHIVCMDKDESKIKMLKDGIIPIYEPNLKELFDKHKDRIELSTNIEETVKKSDVIFIAVGTPPSQDGSADLKYVRAVAKEIGMYIDGYKVIVNKSTVPIGTAKMVNDIISETLKERNQNFEFDVVSNPEFLREGRAVNDCLWPDRIVVGTNSPRAKKIMQSVYSVLFIRETPFVFTNEETAEMIKYAANSFLAVKISFINEIALLCEKVGANVQEVSKAMGMDGRISPKFLHAGPGYGGSCFPKDTLAIYDIGLKYDEELKVIKAAIEANEKQKQKMVSKIINTMDVKGKTLAVLGLSFKPETDDMRDAPSIPIISGLIQNGAIIKAYCPEGMKESKWRLKDFESSITYCKDEYLACENSDAIIILTEWNVFRGMDLDRVSKTIKNNYLFDFRNIYNNNNSAYELFKYHPLGISNKAFKVVY